MKCAFCELPEIRARLVTENEHAWAFPTNIPIVPGHLLVVPNRCVLHMEDLTSIEIIGIMELAYQLKKALTKIHGAQGFNIAWNEGAVAGQSVPHLHLHLVPRKDGDTGIYGYEPRQFLYRPGSREVTPEAELHAVSAELRSFF